MATYTRQELKHDKLIDAAHSGASWIEQHRNQFITTVVVAIVALAVLIGGYSWYSARSTQAATAFGEAVATYQSPIRPLNAPPDPSNESYATSTERAQTANKKFVAVAEKYEHTEDGHNAAYYAGVTFAELGQNASAEEWLKKAETGSRDLANLARVALASLYHSTGRDPQAIAAYKEIIEHPSTTVPVNEARLDLASLYESAGNTAEARKLWAQVKDADKTGAAGQIAADKLAGRTSPQQ